MTDTKIEKVEINGRVRWIWKVFLCEDGEWVLVGDGRSKAMGDAFAAAEGFKDINFLQE